MVAVPKPPPEVCKILYAVILLSLSVPVFPCDHGLLSVILLSMFLLLTGDSECGSMLFEYEKPILNITDCPPDLVDEV